MQKTVYYFSSNSGKRHLFMKGKCTWKWFLFYCLPFRGKKSYAKRQLLSTYLTQVWIYVYLLVVLQLCFDFEAQVWLVIR